MWASAEQALAAQVSKWLEQLPHSEHLECETRLGVIRHKVDDTRLQLPVKNPTLIRNRVDCRFDSGIDPVRVLTAFYSKEL
jgi:hypothetical protein